MLPPYIGIQDTWRTCYINIAYLSDFAWLLLIAVQVRAITRYW